MNEKWWNPIAIDEEYEPSIDISKLDTRHIADLAYIAGFFDGEGTLGIFKTRNRYELRADITNTCLPALLWIKEKLGGLGSICGYGQNQRRDRKTPYKLRFSPRQAKKFLELIWSFLLEKRVRALMAIEYQNKKEDGLMTPELTKLYRMVVRTLSTKSRGENVEGPSS